MMLSRRFSQTFIPVLLLLMLGHPFGAEGIGFKSRAEKALTAAEIQIGLAEDSALKKDTQAAVTHFLNAIEALDIATASDATFEAGKVAIKRAYAQRKVAELKLTGSKNDDLLGQLNSELDGAAATLTLSEREKRLLGVIQSLRADLAMIIERDQNAKRLPTTAAWQQKIDELQESLNGLQKSYSEQGDALGEARSNYKKLESAVAGMNLKGQADSREEKDYARMKQQLDKRLSELNIKYEKLEDDHLNALADVRNYKQLMAKNPAEKLGVELEREQRASNLLQKRVAELERALREMERNALTERGRSRFLSDLDTAAARYKKLQDEHVQARADVKTLQRDLVAARKESVSQKSLKSARRENADLQDRLIDVKQQLSEMVDTAEKLETRSDEEVSSLKSSNADLKDKINDMRRATADADRAAKSSERKGSAQSKMEFARLKRENAEMADQLVKMRNEGKGGFFRREDGVVVTPELKQSRLKYAGLEDKYLQLKAEVKALREAMNVSSDRVVSGLPVGGATIPGGVGKGDADKARASASANATDRMLASSSDVVTKARELLRAEKLDEAYAVLGAGLSKTPNDQGMLLLMGMTCCQMEKFNVAIKVLDHLSELSPSNAKVHILLGTANMGLRKLGPAMIELRRAMDINPQISEVHYNLSQIYMSIDPPDAEIARDYYDRSVELGGQRDADLESRIDKGL